MVFSEGRRDSPLWPTPARSGYLPVIKAERAGAQTGAFEYQFRQTVPRAASLSILGVFRSRAPR